MTIEQQQALEDAARREWEATTKVGEFTIAQLRKVSDQVFNRSNWKAPWVAYVPRSRVKAVIAATEFYHADIAQVEGIEPLTGRVRMSGKGYQAD